LEKNLTTETDRQMVDHLHYRFAVNWATVKWATENWATGKFGNGKFGNHFLVGSIKSATVKPGNGKLCNR